MTFVDDLRRVLASRPCPQCGDIQRLQRAELLAREADKQLTEIREQQETRDAEKDADHPRNVARRAAKK